MYPPIRLFHKTNDVDNFSLKSMSYVYVYPAAFPETPTRKRISECPSSHCEAIFLAVLGYQLVSISYNCNTRLPPTAGTPAARLSTL